MTTLQQFLDGEPMSYVGYDRRTTYEATYRAGVGIVIDEPISGKRIGVAKRADQDWNARAFHDNQTRSAT